MAEIWISDDENDELSKVSVSSFEQDQPHHQT
jgi:hypothetical protein